MFIVGVVVAMTALPAWPSAAWLLQKEAATGHRNSVLSAVIIETVPLTVWILQYLLLQCHKSKLYLFNEKSSPVA